MMLCENVEMIGYSNYLLCYTVLFGGYVSLVGSKILFIFIITSLHAGTIILSMMN